jgi:hypothetical protein
LFKGNQKEDAIHLIVQKNVEGLGFIETECMEGKKINKKMH